MPSEVLLNRSFEENLPRLLAAAGTSHKPQPPEVAEAILGGAEVALPPLRVVLEDYVDLTKTRHMRKSDKQRHLWRLPREQAVANFEKAVPKRQSAGIDKITREDAPAFRNWWGKRVRSGKTRAETANNDFGHLSQLFREWCEVKGHLELENPFTRLRFDKSLDPLVSRPPFSRDWLETKLLAPGAFGRLNAEATDVFMVLINTGLRPSEVLSCPLDDFCLDEEIPFIRVAAHGRELKQRHAARDVPLLGVSLKGARRIVSRGGIKRYPHKANSWSGVVNKYLENNGLKETPKHSAYMRVQRIRVHSSGLVWKAPVFEGNWKISKSSLSQGPETKHLRALTGIGPKTAVLARCPKHNRVSRLLQSEGQNYTTGFSNPTATGRIVRSLMSVTDAAQTFC